MSNNVEVTARDLIVRYTGRNGVEDSLGISVNFFPLDCLASEVCLNVDLDIALTVIAHGCYRWLASQLRGFGKAKPKQLYRCFVETGGVIKVEAERVVVRFDKRFAQPDRLRSRPIALPFPGWVTGQLLSNIHDLLGWWEIVTYFRSAATGVYVTVRARKEKDTLKVMDGTVEIWTK